MKKTLSGSLDHSILSMWISKKTSIFTLKIEILK